MFHVTHTASTCMASLDLFKAYFSGVTTLTLSSATTEVKVKRKPYWMDMVDLRTKTDGVSEAMDRFIRSF